MIGVLMLLSFSLPLAATLAVRRYLWIGVCAVLVAVVAVPVLYKVATGTHDPMGWGFAMVLVFMPALIGSTIGGAITAFRRWRMGPGPITALNISLAVILAAISFGFGLWVAMDY